MTTVRFNLYFDERKACPACHFLRFKELYACDYLKNPIKQFVQRFYRRQGAAQLEYLEKARYVIVECVRCKLLFQRYIPNRILSERIYEHWIDPKISKQKALKNTINIYFIQEVRLILKYLKLVNIADAQFFDYGMGWGKWCLAAKAAGCKVFGSELSKPRIDHAKQHGIEVLPWDEIPNHAFDFINTDQVIEHVPNPFETIAHLTTALKPQGLIKINVPNGFGIKQKLVFNNWKRTHGPLSFNAILPLEHINCFTKKTILKMAYLAGLQSAKIPMRMQYATMTRMSTIKETFRNLINPIYRNLTPLGTYCLFKKDNRETASIPSPE